MSTTILLIKPIKGISFVMYDVATEEHINQACEQLYNEWRFDPHFVLMMQDDYDVLFAELKQKLADRRTYRADTGESTPIDTVRVITLKKIINPATGGTLDIFVTDNLRQRAVIFGSFGQKSEEPNPGTWPWVEVSSQILEQAPKYTRGVRVNCLAQSVSFTGVIEQAGPGGLYHVEAEIGPGRTMPLFVQEQEIIGLVEDT